VPRSRAAWLPPQPRWKRVMAQAATRNVGRLPLVRFRLLGQVTGTPSVSDLAVSRSHEQIIDEGQSRHPSGGRGGVPPCGAILAARGSRTRGPRAVVVGATVRGGFVQGCGTAIELVASFGRRQRRILRRPLRGWRRNSTSSRRTSRTDGSFTSVPRSGLKGAR
jgi:hypothetical protein